MKHSTKISLLTAGAALSMAFTMPSCPGQEAMQQQVDQLKGEVMNHTRKLGDATNNLKTMTDESAAMKALVTQMAQEVQAQKQSIDQLTAKIAAMETQMASMKSAPARSAPRPTATKKRR